MFTSKIMTAVRKPMVLCQILGFLIFATAFFLPAITLDKDTFDHSFPVGWPAGVPFSPWDNSRDIAQGWYCAQFAFRVPFDFDNYKFPETLLVTLSGWTNLLVLTYLGFSFLPKFVKTRRFLAMAIPLCLIATWLYFAIGPIYPLIGHSMWIVGAFMIIAPEIADLFVKRRIGQELLSPDL